MKHRCPVCHRIIKASIQEESKKANFFPFCSRRCKLIDLGAWLDAKYRIVSEPDSQESGKPFDTSADTNSDKQ